MIWTPGVNLAVGDGEMGQRYGDPGAVLSGSDCIIVGSGIPSRRPASCGGLRRGFMEGLLQRNG